MGGWVNGVASREVYGEIYGPHFSTLSFPPGTLSRRVQHTLDIGGMATPPRTTRPPGKRLRQQQPQAWRGTGRGPMLAGEGAATACPQPAVPASSCRWGTSSPPARPPAPAPQPRRPAPPTPPAAPPPTPNPPAYNPGAVLDAGGRHAGAYILLVSGWWRTAHCCGALPATAASTGVTGARL